MKATVNFKVFLLLIASVFAFSILRAQSSRKLDSLRNTLTNVRTDSGKVALIVSQAEKMNCSDTSLVLGYLAEALTLAEKIRWDHGICKVRFALANVYAQCEKNYDLAENQWHAALDITTGAAGKADRMFALQQFAWSHVSRGQYLDALRYFRQVLSMDLDPDNKMGTLGNIGLVYSKIGDFNDALIYYDSSLRVLDNFIKEKGINDPNYVLQRGVLLATIGDIYVSMSKYENALRNYDSVLKIKIKDPQFEEILKVCGLLGVANVYHMKKEFPKAIQYYRKALEVTDKNDDKVTIMSSLGNIYLGLGNLDTAYSYANGALELAEKHGIRDQLPAIYITLGQVFTARKDFPGAISYLHAAIDICERNGVMVSKKDAWEALSNTYQQMGQPALAFEAYKKFISVRDSVFSIDKANEFTRKMAEWEFQKQKEQIAIENELQMQKQRNLTYSGYFGLLLVLLVSFFIYRGYKIEKKSKDSINKEKQVSENLLLNILPEDTAKELKANGAVKAKLFENVTVLFTDFVNFTQASERMSSEDLVAELHTCFKAFDEVISKYRIEKIKTVGDAYIAVSGLPNPNPGHAVDVINAAQEFVEFMTKRKAELGDKTFSMRVGVNSGTVVAGIVGVKKFAFDIWGDTVNIAARMEQNGEEGKINISQSTYEIVKDKFTCTFRGEIDAKNKGRMRMYFVS